MSRRVRLPRRAFPESALNVVGPNERTVEFFAASGCRAYAEIGVYEGHTARRIAEVLDGAGAIHLFDYEDRVSAVASMLRDAGHANVVEHPNSRRLLDSYNWSLMQVLAESDGPVFDYIFLDGAHTWTHDAPAFFLADRLLAPGGYLDFDDYSWTLRASPSMNPSAFPEVEALYTDEQIDARQVALVVDLLVRRDGRYDELVPNKIFRKRPES
jgi:predicted O-methyltransferase YrrM